MVEYMKFSFKTNKLKEQSTGTNIKHCITYHFIVVTITECTYFATSGLQWTGDRWLLRTEDKEERKKMLILQKQVVTTGH